MSDDRSADDAVLGEYERERKVVRAAREQEVKVAQDTRFNLSTRKHILEELRMLEKAFESG